MKYLDNVVLNIYAILLGCIFSAFGLELFSRLLPATSYFPLEKPIVCDNHNFVELECLHRRKSNRRARFTRGKLPPFKVDSIKTTNDIGQFTNVKWRDFKQNKNNSLRLLSIGDSYVEALQVDNNKSFHGLLNDKNISSSFMDQQKIMSIGIGATGMAFPNYLKYIEFAKNETNMNNVILVIPIISNDFDESFPKYVAISRRAEKGQFFFKRNGEFTFKPFSDEKIVDKLITYSITYSAFARYLTYNLPILQSLHKNQIYCFLTYPRCQNKNYKYAANIIEENPETNPVRYQDGFLASRIFINKLSLIRTSISERRKTILVVDADRNHIHGKHSKSIFFDSQRKYFIQLALSRGFTVIDMEYAFRKHYNINSREFNTSIDGHWNELGHKLVAEKVYQAISKLFAASY